jgi:SH3-like domain-containing protein
VQRATGYAYAGPNALNLRKDLGPRTPVVETVQHGEKLEVLETRRRFAKVRTSRGTEGWADSNLLLTQRQMDDLDALATKTAALPSQGRASVYDVLNVHTDASRGSPSFTQIPEGGSVEVLAHRVTAQGAAPKRAAKPAPKQKPTAKGSKAPVKESGLPPPPPPPAPSLPPDWIARSVPRVMDLQESKTSSAQKSPGEDWFLVRMSDGKAGWVLSRMLYMQIPDEVAQYAEGQRITAYLSLGEVAEKDATEKHHNWLWTTSSSGVHPYDFDGFRVFVWSTRRRHYETAFIERNVRGYYPIQAVDAPNREEKGFSLVVEDKDGRPYKRTYAFSGYHIRMIAKEPWEKPPDLPAVSDARTFDPEPEPEVSSAGWFDGVRKWWQKRGER